MISFVLIDKLSSDRERIKMLLSSQKDFEFRGFGNDGCDALKLVLSHKPDVVIIDPAVDFYNGFEVSHLLKNRSPGTAIVMLGSCLDEHMAPEFITAPIAAYLLKEEDIDSLAGIVRKVKAGEFYVNQKIGCWAFQFLANILRKKQSPVCHSPLPKLSQKEMRIFTFIAQGQSDKEIARKIGLKDGTIRNYVSKIMRKTGTNNRSRLTSYAINCGFSGVEE
jgi:DNA-binding NarL/FixJ family response regulator